MSNDMRVYQMNECDWVAARCVEDTIEFYCGEYDMTEDELDVHASNLNTEGMYIEVTEKDAF